MTVLPQLTIAGNNDLASEMARHALSAGLANPVYLWRDPRDPLPARTPVIVVADPDGRAAFCRETVASGLVTVTLPLEDLGTELATATEAGTLRQISRLHGIPTLARLHRDALAGREGRRYGIYAVHRLPRNHAGEVATALRDLVVYVVSLGGGQLQSVRATSASFHANGDGWFILARFADESIATIEVSAVLPESDAPAGELLIEVTGSESVLRAEPERQSVIINSSDGVSRQSWYAEPAGPLLDLALRTIASGDPMRQTAAMHLLPCIREAASSDHVVPVT